MGILNGSRPEMTLLPGYQGYVDRLDDVNYKGGPGMGYFRDIIQKWRQGRGGEIGSGIFDAAIGQAYQDIDRTASPLSFLAAGEAGGALGDRYRELQRERARDSVNSQRFGLAFDAARNAAGEITAFKDRQARFRQGQMESQADAYRNGMYDNRRTGGIGGALIQGALGAGLGALTGGIGTAAMGGLGGLFRGGSSAGGGR